MNSEVTVNEANLKACASVSDKSVWDRVVQDHFLFDLDKRSSSLAMNKITCPRRSSSLAMNKITSSKRSCSLAVIKINCEIKIKITY